MPKKFVDQMDRNIETILESDDEFPSKYTFRPVFLF